LRKKLYLANPYGFSKQTKTLLHEFIEIFNDLNVEVFEPFERAKRLIKMLERLLKKDYLYTEEELKTIKSQLRTVKEELAAAEAKSSKGFK